MKAVVAAILSLALLTPASVLGSAQLPGAAERLITVMSRNVYHGVDAEIAGVLGATSFAELAQRVTDVYHGYHERDFAARAAAMASEVEDSRPALIGLQEAMLVRTDAPADGPATPATTVDLDYVQLLLDALAARGLRYHVVAETTVLDIELPSTLGIDVRHTDREVILARTDLPPSQLRITNPQGGTFATTCTIPSATLGPISISLGWAAVDAQVRGREFRFISTHLDVACLPFTSAIQRAQAAELRAGPAATDLPVVLVGDLNSPADGTGETYGDMLASGFQDAWSASVEPGLTCCQADDLLNATSMLQARIDFVLFREGSPPRGAVASMRAVAADTVGDEPADKTPSGLWPSDHAGVVATLRLGHP